MCLTPFSSRSLGITLQHHILDVCAPDILHENNALRATSNTPVTRGAASDNGRRHPQRPRDPDIVVLYCQTRGDSGVVVSIDFAVQLLLVCLWIETELQLNVRPDRRQERDAILLRINGCCRGIKTLLGRFTLINRHTKAIRVSGVAL